MRKITLVTILMLLPFKSSFAINVGNITEIIDANNSTLAKEVENTVATARLVNLSIEKIDLSLIHI